MRFDTAHQHIIAVVEQVMSGHRSRDVIARGLDKLDCVGSGDVLEHDAQVGKRFGQWDQCSVNKGLFSIKDVNAVVGDFPMDQEC